MNKKNLIFKLSYSVNGAVFETVKTETEHFTLSLKEENGILTADIAPKCALKILDFKVNMPYKFEKSDRIYANGYQSWTDSLEYAPDSQMSEYSSLTEFLVTKSPLSLIGFSKSSDITFHKYPRRPGVFYGWSYGYIRKGENVEIFGSLSERSGYTEVIFDAANSLISIGKELEGVTFTEETNLLSFAFIEGEYDEAFDKYFEAMGVKCRNAEKRCGYTTWYNYYGNVTGAIVKRDLDSIAKLDTKIDCFQIDDGYQTAIGDWLSTDMKKFPEGMKKAAEDIHSKDMLAGLWLAPFAGVPSSKLFKEHKDWFIKGENGKPYKTGHNWGGFYSLDIYNPEARAYIKHVFDVVLNDWGYDLVKLDFLYGACLRSMHNKTRGEIMCDAMDFLRECCGDKLIIGCGVPVMPAFGKVDYCRIGCDVALNWKRAKHAIREEVSTPHAVCNSAFRRHLNGRAWMNDPDVFLLRDTNIKMTMEQRALLAKINAVCGSLLFVSDNVADYSKEQSDILAEVFAKKDYKIKRAELVEDDIMEIEYLENGENKTLRFHAHTGEAC